MIRPFHSSPLIPFLLFFVLGSDAVFSAPTHTPTATRSPSPSPTPGPLPDLTIYGPAANPFLITQIYFFTSCEVVEGCVAEGTRRLLRFTTQTRNIGAGDLYLGNPSGNPLFHFSECHGHYHLDNYMEYRLKDGANQIVVGYKQGFCLLDSLRFDPGANPSPIYNCVNQGIQAGWADEYVADLPCQYIDVTGVAAGTYTLEMEVNPQRVLMETNYANNITTLTIVIPALPSPTPTPSPTASPSPTSSPSPTLPPPVILRQPADQKANAGQDIVFSIEAAGTPSPDYQWFKGASSLAGKTTPTLTLPDVALSDAGGYACLASNA
ncbi:immunoglobulin domain-containing protein, partial [Candidatus Sumerlaeota bacterium]|nr:immunoglobulin domain-containing protein [Candidatus Sumerlaeota bacterium]